MAIQLPCYCASLRQAARTISQQYDQAVRPAKLTITQFTIMMMLRHRPGIRVGELAEALAMDQTTISRTVALMRRDGLIEQEESQDRRERRWVLTAIGHRRYEKALPLWEAAQQKIEAGLGPGSSKRLKALAF